jgi:SAM-dependent methyltransferase
MLGLTRANLRHLVAFVRQPSNPAAAVYDSLGADFFLSPAPGWLNLGLWDGPGEAGEAESAVRRLVARLAAELPTGGDVLDAGNGLGAGDAVIAEVAAPRRLIALNITESQLRAGRSRLSAAGAQPVVGDATRIPLADNSVDGVISVEAAFHFPSRARFFAEAHRVLRPGGVLTMSDVSVERMVPLDPLEALAGFTNLRVWGLRKRNLASADAIATALGAAGFGGVEVEVVTDRVLDPAIAFFRARAEADGGPALHRLGARILLSQWALLRRRGMMEYVLIRAHAPS